MIRVAREGDAVALHNLYAACHPGWPAKHHRFWWSHPTLVLEADYEIVGATAFALAPAPSPDLFKVVRSTNAEIAWGHGVYVAPHAHKRGYGWRLAEARHQTLKDLGIEFFLGMTQPTNHAMQRIFQRQKLTKHALIPNAYPDGGAGVMYVGGIV